MSTNSPNTSDNQEIDLSQISKKVGQTFENLSTSIFKGLLFLKRNIIILAVLFIIGAGLGYYLDKTTKIYNHQIIVTPNFSSVDYMYSKIELINSKINEGDTVFLKQVVGIQNPSRLGEIKIKPIMDVYRFVDNKPDYFELMKLMAEDGDMSKIIVDDVTSKNYTYHQILFTTNKMTTDEMTVKPLLHYLNDTEYFQNVRSQYEKNVKIKMVQNDSLIKQIDGVLEAAGISGGKSSSVSINDNGQLAEVIKSKDALLAEQGSRRIELLNIDSVIKKASEALNVRNLKSTNGKMKMVLPVLFIMLFILGGFFLAYYKRQMRKLKN